MQILPSFWVEGSLFFMILSSTIFASAVSKSDSRHVFKILGLALMALSGLCFFSSQSFFQGYVKGFMLGSTGLMLSFIYPYIAEESYNIREWLLLVLCITLGGIIAVGSSNFITMFVGLELQNLALVVLCAQRGGGTYNIEAAIKFFICNALSSVIMLIGIAMIYISYGTVNFEILGELTRNNVTSVIGVTSIATSLAFKCAFFPLHEWLLDVYKGLSRTALFCFNLAPKITTFALLYKVFNQPFQNTPWINEIFALFAIVSLVISALGGLGQSDIKRLMAYSTIGHVSYIALSVCYFMPQSVMGFYTFCYIVSTFMMFYAILNSKGDLSSGLEFNSEKSKTTMIIAALVIGSFPPFGMFFAKIPVFHGLIETKAYFTLAIAAVCSVISGFYYVRLSRFSYDSTIKGVQINYFIPFFMIALLSFSFLWVFGVWGYIGSLITH